MLNQITSIIIDDEPDSIIQLERAIKSIDGTTVVGTALDAQEGLELIIDKNPSLIFVDINMPNKDGFWLANKVHKLNKPIDIVFVTGYDEYAIKAIKYAAFDYLTKPIIPDLLKETIKRHIEKSDRDVLNDNYKRLKSFLNKDKIKFTNSLGFIMVDPNEIIYCEADGNYCKIYTSNNRQELVTCQLGLIEKKLSQKTFLRISRSVIINMDFLHSFNRKEKTVLLSNQNIKVELKASNSGVKKLILI